MKKYFSKQAFANVKKYALAHKFISGAVAIVILGGGYYGYAKMASASGEILYTTGTVAKGSIISTVSGSGQVSTTNKVDVKAKVSGDITWVNVKAGDVVYAGQALAGIDSRDAKIAVADAEASLAQAKLQFQKDSASAPLDYQKTLDNLDSAKVDLATTLNDTFNTLSTTYLDLPGIITGTQNILYGYNISSAANIWNIDAINNFFNNIDIAREKILIISTSAKNDYAAARTKYDASFLEYKGLSRTSSEDTLENFLDKSIDTSTSIAQAIQSELNLLGSAIDNAQTYNVTLPSSITTMQTNARNYLSTVNSDLSSLLAKKKAIVSAKQSIKSYEDSIALLKVGNESGSNPISLQIAQNSLAKQERNLQDLKTELYKYTVTSPFAGTISSVTARVGDSAGTVATVVTNEQIAELTLNEVDAAKVKAGQKATLSFDAFDDLSLTGTVAEVDPVGTVSQGVVSYTVKIKFDTQDARVKPGMTVNATIQTDAHIDVLYVPSSAVKTLNGMSFVQMFAPPLAESGIASETLPTQVPVTVGITDDTNVEIVSGLKEGDQVVTKTTNSAVKTMTATGARTTNLGGGNVIRGASAGTATFSATPIRF